MLYWIKSESHSNSNIEGLESSVLNRPNPIYGTTATCTLFFSSGIWKCSKTFVIELLSKCIISDSKKLWI